jgi:integrase
VLLTGLRISPTCALKVGDLSFDPPTIRSLVKGAKVQVVEMHPALRDLLYTKVTSKHLREGIERLDWGL